MSCNFKICYQRKVIYLSKTRLVIPKDGSFRSRVRLKNNVEHKIPKFFLDNAVTSRISIIECWSSTAWWYTNLCWSRVLRTDHVSKNVLAMDGMYVCILVLVLCVLDSNQTLNYDTIDPSLFGNKIWKSNSLCVSLWLRPAIRPILKHCDNKSCTAQIDNYGKHETDSAR